MAQEQTLNDLPPAGGKWLEAHHRAKLPERRAFCQRLAALQPSRVLDVGCGTGLWLDLLNELLPPDCEFIGLDYSEASIAEASQRAETWSRQASFKRVDLNAPPFTLPDADLTLMFNVSSYIGQLDPLLDTLARRPGHVVIRQYDGGGMRFGPMSLDDRVLIESSLRVAMTESLEFRHYDLDRLYAGIERAPFTQRDLSFALFEGSSPFPDEFADYFTGTMSWMLDCLPAPAGECLQSWWTARKRDPGLPTYFTEVDLCAILS